MDNKKFNWQVLTAIEELIDRSGMTRAEIITNSGMRRNTFFAKMRGETSLTTEDISKLASALKVEPEIFFKPIENVSPIGNNVYQIGDLERIPADLEAEIRAQGIAAKKGNPESEQ